MAQDVLKIAHLIAMIYISMQSSPSLEKISSYDLLPRFRYIWLLVEYKKSRVEYNFVQFRSVISVAR